MGNLGDLAALALVGFETASTLATLDRIDPQLASALEHILARMATFALQDATAGSLVDDGKLVG